MTRKILLSPSFGAGWSTWNGSTPEQEQMALFDEKLIAAVESKNPQLLHDALEDFCNRWQERFNDIFYAGGARDLEVVEVDGPFIVEEYDGSESLRFREKVRWI